MAEALAVVLTLAVIVGGCLLLHPNQDDECESSRRKCYFSETSSQDSRIYIPEKRKCCFPESCPNDPRIYPPNRTCHGGPCGNSTCTEFRLRIWKRILETMREFRRSTAPMGHHPLRPMESCICRKRPIFMIPRDIPRRPPPSGLSFSLDPGKCPRRGRESRELVEVADRRNSRRTHKRSPRGRACKQGSSSSSIKHSARWRSSSSRTGKCRARRKRSKKTQTP